MQLIRYMGDDPTICKAVSVQIGDNIRTTDVPCGLYCSRPDFRNWRAVTRALIDNAMQARPDLPAAIRQKLGELATEVAAMPEDVWGNGDRTHRLAKIYEWVQCVMLWDPKSTDIPTDLPKKDTSETNPLSNIQNLMLLALGILVVSKLGGR